MAAAKGCTALLRRKATPLLHPLDGPQGKALLEAFMREVHVPSFAQKERQACLEMWLVALQVRRACCWRRKGRLWPQRGKLASTPSIACAAWLP